MSAVSTYANPNARGTGSSVSLILHPANEKREGYITCYICKQTQVCGTVPSFDVTGGLMIHLDRDDLAEILCVLRGMSESVGEGRGLFHRNNSRSLCIKFAHFIEPKSGYLLSTTVKKDGKEDKYDFFFTPMQAFSFMLGIEQAMMYIMFGIPKGE